MFAEDTEGQGRQDDKKGKEAYAEYIEEAWPWEAADSVER
jgi:hypothetical protein